MTTTNKYYRSFIFFLFLILGMSNNETFATHVSGGDISYTCLGGNQYLFKLSLYRRCSGSTLSSSQSLTLNSSCGSRTESLTQVGPINGTEISQLCPPDSLNSECNGGPLPGLQRYDFEAIIFVPSCADWVISWSTCCRNTSINVLNSLTESIYIEATMDNVISICNNSPAFTAQPIPYVCANQPINYNFGVIELDGDSLVYKFIGCRETSTSYLSYIGPYSPINSINGISINSTTGVLSFTPTTIGNFIVVVLVEEYDASGNLIGTVMRDIQFVVQNCINIPPDLGAGAVTNFGGNGTQISPFQVELCEGDSIYFQMIYTDPDAGDSIRLSSNVNIVLPNANFSWIGGNPAIATFSWVAPGGSSGLNTAFSVTADDQSCPVSAFQTFVYDIQVTEATVAGPDVVICPSFGVSAQLDVSGGTIFNWSVVSGDPINIGSNFSCNPCYNPVASPSITTVYAVSSNLGTACTSKDTVVVTVNNVITTPHNFTDSFCLTAPIFNYSGFPNPGFWTGLTISATGDFDPLSAGLGNHVVTYMTIDPNCLANDEYIISIDVIGPTVDLTAHDTSIICAGDLVEIQGQVTGGLLPHNFWWSNDPTEIDTFQIVSPGSSTIYTLYATDFCAVDTAMINIYVDVPVYSTIKILGGDTIRLLCPGHPVNYKPSAFGGSGGYIFTWDNWLTTDSVLSENPDTTMLYIVEVTDFCRTDTIIDSVHVLVPDFDPITVIHPDTVFGCAGDEFDLFTLTTGGSGTYNYWWNKLLTDNDSISIVRSNSETHIFVATDLCFEDDTVTIEVIVKEPTANFDMRFWDLEEVFFIDRSESDIVSYNWDFGDGDDSDQMNPTHSFPFIDLYTVTLEVTNDEGCIDSISKFIEPPLAIWVPSAFTPNGDGVNDNFTIQTVGLDRFEIKIFNRWGKLLFQETDPKKFWDGRFNGNNVKDGVYIYEIKAAGVTTERFKKRGTVTIIQ